jgi:Domain of unknown function (DUF4159)
MWIVKRIFLLVLPIFVLWAVLIGPDVSNAQEAQGDITAEQVRETIDKGVTYLRQQQKVDGSWDDYAGQPGGESALCTLALLNAGVEPGDPQIQKALVYLRKFEPERTYVTSLQTMVFVRADPHKDSLLINRNVKWLERMQITDGPRIGAWSYPQGSGDNSNSQFALLALYEAERAGIGIQVSDRTWRKARTYWEDCQNPDGSWGYYKHVPGTGSMTCAGITSLVITADRIEQADAKAVGEKIQCCGQSENDTDKGVDRALNWLGANFSVSRNPNQPGGTWQLYYLYGLERAGRLTARRFIGKADWYREGAKFLVDHQDRLSGFWSGTGMAEDSRLIGTSFGLLFLSKGRWPVLISKLKHPPDDDWNQHRHDLNNLTRFVESRWKKDLTWQVVDLRLASVEDLLQAPVLFLCGSESPLPNDPTIRGEVVQKLRDYVDRGGFLFAEAYCGDSGFDKGFRELMTLVFPEPEYRLRLLEPEHPIWHAEEVIPTEQLRPLLGIDFGCRTSVIYAPLDPADNPRPSLSCLWELARSGRGQTFKESVKAQIDAALGLGINILAYATNRELRGKEENFNVPSARRPGDQAERGRLYIAKIRHPGGCNTAPRALVNLLDLASRELKIRATAREELLNLTDDSLFDYHLVFMQGRNSFHFTDAERGQLKKYIERGGMVFVDAICASRAFTESFRREMAAIFPQNKLERIPVDDPLLSPKFGGFDLKIVTRRDPQDRGAKSPLSATLKKVAPDLDGIKFDDRWGVIFSPYDVSCALEKLDSLECRGYIREDAAKIGLNVILYSLQQ